MEGEIKPQDGGECYQASRKTEEAAKKRTDCLEKIIQPYENDSDEHTSKYDQRKAAPEPFNPDMRGIKNTDSCTLIYFPQPSKNLSTTWPLCCTGYEREEEPAWVTDDKPAWVAKYDSTWIADEEENRSFQLYENDTDKHTYLQLESSKYDRHKAAQDLSPKAGEIENHRTSHSRMRANHNQA
ncbi:hypothetical protein F4604DRAFT_1689058 [Suillus subluteus]|nr:hypothetical protein F4604DRAFT_1689058 [Suillus subluteus]